MDDSGGGADVSFDGLGASSFSRTPMTKHPPLPMPSSPSKPRSRQTRKSTSNHPRPLKHILEPVKPTRSSRPPRICRRTMTMSNATRPGLSALRWTGVYRLPLLGNPILARLLQHTLCTPIPRGEDRRRCRAGVEAFLDATRTRVRGRWLRGRIVAGSSGDCPTHRGDTQ